MKLLFVFFKITKLIKNKFILISRILSGVSSSNSESILDNEDLDSLILLRKTSQNPLDRDQEFGKKIHLEELNLFNL